jgi:HK97 family phage major capsid protein
VIRAYTCLSTFKKRNSNHMSNSKIQDLQTKRNQIIFDASQLVNKGLKTPEARAQYAAMLADIDVIASDISTLESLTRKLAEIPVTPPSKPTISTKDTPEVRKQKLSTAYRSLLRHGFLRDAPEQRDVLTSNDGAAIIPQEFADTLSQALKWYGPIATLVSRRDVDSGAPQKFSISDDTSSTMTYLSESSNTSSVEEDSVLLSQITSTDALVSVIKWSLQMMDDASGFESFIRDIAGLRAARSIETALTTGKDGSGIALPNSPVGGLLANVTTGVTTSSLSAGIPYASLVALAGSTDHAYYVNGSFMASPSVHNYLLTQVTTIGTPLYPIDPVTGCLTICGKTLWVNNSMPAYNAASSPVVLFGDYSKAYAYVNVGLKIRILRERFVPDAMLGAAVLHTRIGAATLVSGAVKALVTAAS